MHPSDLLRTPILGPWVRSAGVAERRQQVYISLAHWFEAAKFTPHQPALRDALLFSPTLKEARKFAHARKELWRSDWPVTRAAVLIAGLGMLTLQRPEMGLRSCDLSLVREGLAPMKLPERFVDACLERFDLWREAPRLATFGAEAAPESVAGAKLAKLVAPIPTWTLVAPCTRRAAWRVHDWALTHYVPVHYIGGSEERMGRPLARRMVDESDQVIVFEQRRAKRFDHVLQYAKAAKKKVSLELYDPLQDTNAPQLPGLR